MAHHRYALIMAGGRGTRFWPRSRKRTAKQVLRFFGERSLIQQAVDRLEGVIPPENIWVITNDYLQAEIQRQLPNVPKQQIIAEPAQRNTAPCIGLAAQILAGIDPDAVIGVFPADHLILKETRFRTFVKAAYKAAERDEVVVLGIQPRWAETGYGYIEFGKKVEIGGALPQKVKSFREKPDERTARKFVASGNFFWNAGMFFWRAATVLELLRQPSTEDSHAASRAARVRQQDSSAQSSHRPTRFARTFPSTTPSSKRPKPFPASRSTTLAGTMWAVGKLCMGSPRRTRTVMPPRAISLSKTRPATMYTRKRRSRWWA